MSEVAGWAKKARRNNRLRRGENGLRCQVAGLPLTKEAYDNLVDISVLVGLETVEVASWILEYGIEDAKYALEEAH
jgi:hypothetical protein